MPLSAGTPTAARPTAAILALLAWAAILLQFYVSIILAPPAGMPLATLIINVLSYFTVLSNLLVAIVTSFIALTPEHSPSRNIFLHPAIQAATATYIAVVGIVYSLVLRGIWSPTGAQKIADILLHDAVPLLYTIFWFIFCSSRQRLRWSNAVLWLGWPLTYVIYILVRGSLTGHAFYPFLDTQTLGYPRVFAAIGVITLLYLILGLVAIAITRRRSMAPPHTHEGN